MDANAPSFVVSIGEILTELIREFNTNSSPQIEFNARNVLKKTLGFLNSEESSSGKEKIPLLRKLLYSELCEWLPGDMDQLNNILIPKHTIGDYHQTVQISGFGNAVRAMLSDRAMRTGDTIHTGDKRIMLIGWINICKLIKG